MATDKIEIRTGTKDATLRGQRPHKVSAPRAGPTPYKYYTYMGPKTKKADFRPARVPSLIPFFPAPKLPLNRRGGPQIGLSSVSRGMPCRQQMTAGHPSRKAEKNGTREGTRGHIRIQTDLFHSQLLVLKSTYSHPRHRPLYKRVLSAWRGNNCF